MPSAADGDGGMSAKAPSIAQLVTSHKDPPPETHLEIARRRWLLFSFWAVAIFLGLPIWLWTTTVYRAGLPLARMNSWAAGHACQLEYPLHISIDAPSMRAQERDALIRLTQQTFDDSDEGSLQHLTFGPSSMTADLTIAVRANTDRDANGEYTTALRPYEPILDIALAPSLFTSPGTTSLSQISKAIVAESRNIFADEQLRLQHLFNSADYKVRHPQQLTEQDKARLDQRSARAFKYSSVYHLTFSLFSATATPRAWDIRLALDETLAPLLSSFSAISNFTIDTQLQYFASLSPSIRRSTEDRSSQRNKLSDSDLSGFINTAEWPLSPTIGDGLTINFVLYVPHEDNDTMMIEGSKATSWLIPQWGGVKIVHNSWSSVEQNTKLSKAQLEPIVLVFADQLTSLLGLPSSPASLPLRLSSLTRERATALILSASSTLGALSRLTLKLTSIAIPDNVAVSVDETLVGLNRACSALREAKYEDALGYARDAQKQAELAFFDPSMVGQVYFPDEHKVAVYVPLLGPMAVPLIMALLKELKAKFKR